MTHGVGFRATRVGWNSESMAARNHRAGGLT